MARYLDFLSRTLRNGIHRFSGSGKISILHGLFTGKGLLMAAFQTTPMLLYINVSILYNVEIPKFL